ncbi:hypothetical protein BC833DRAFT_626733 [Globomyces pollinis-pini]|nr:hypothetical protein BC833DRAFT_626733 [Globomyces pollinis-pini]
MLYIVLLPREREDGQALKTQEELIRYRNDANEAENHVKDLTMMNEQLMTKISRMSEQIAEQDEAEMNTLKSQLNDSLEKINRLQKENMELIDKLDDLEDHNKALQDNLSSLKAKTIIGLFKGTF